MMSSDQLVIRISKTVNSRFFPAVALLLLLAISCQSLVEVDPPVTAKTSENVFSDDATAAAVLTGLYAKLSRDNYTFFSSGANDITSISLFPALSADELTLYDLGSTRYSQYYTNSLSSTPVGQTADYWTSFYRIVYLANSAIEGLNGSTTITPVVKQQLLGESLYVRAFCYFYLVNLFGDVPLVTSTDWQVNSTLPRTPANQVYQQIVADLTNAQSFLSANYLTADLQGTTSEKVRPTSWAATALLARTYLYMQNWGGAAAQASIVINGGPYTLETLSNAFLKNNSEALWQLFAVGTGSSANTGEGKLFVLPASGPAFNYPVYLSTNVVNSFEPGDQRRDEWVDSVVVGGTTYHYPFKYKVGAVVAANAEYSTIMRLAELYMISAEASAQMGDLTGAASDLNAIRNRAGLPNTTAATQADILAAIEQERKVELFTEWGHRWLDLKRTGRIDAVMTVVAAQKGGAWSSFKALYPIPLAETEKASQLLQNPGY